MWAAMNGKKEVVEALIKAGADVDKANKSGNTPLYVAARKVRGRTWSHCVLAGSRAAQICVARSAS